MKNYIKDTPDTAPAMLRSAPVVLTSTHAKTATTGATKMPVADLGWTSLRTDCGLTQTFRAPEPALPMQNWSTPLPPGPPRGSRRASASRQAEIDAGRYPDRRKPRSYHPGSGRLRRGSALRHSPGPNLAMACGGPVGAKVTRGGTTRKANLMRRTHLLGRALGTGVVTQAHRDHRRDPISKSGAELRLLLRRTRAYGG